MAFMAAKEAILVIDMLNDFVTGKVKCERAQRIIPVLRKLLGAARSANISVVYCGDAHLPQDFELRVWGEHAMAGTEAAEVVPELTPAARDHVVPKRTYSAFHETGLDSLLRGLGVDAVVITGLHTNICVRHTAADAFFRGYRIIVISDGVDAFTQEEHDQGLAYLEKVYGARVTTANTLLEEWRT